MKAVRAFAWLGCATTSAAIAIGSAVPAGAQEYVQMPSSIGDGSTYIAEPAFGQPELDQMLAPVALYPDALLAQVLMAATYPLEVVQASRFLQRNPGLSGDALAQAVAPMGWEPSVTALTQFPSVLAMMNDELDWTQQLGEAFLAQREQVMDTVQRLRSRAYAAGTLQSNEQQHIIVQERVIQIEPWHAHTYRVPYYNPTIVYGGWWHPAHPPFLWVPPVVYRPPYFAQIHSIGYAWGPRIVVSPLLWHDARPVWRGRYVYVNDSYRPDAPGRPTWRDRAGPTSNERRPPATFDRSVPGRGERAGRGASEWVRPDVGERVIPVTRPQVTPDLGERPTPRFRQPDRSVSPERSPERTRQRPEAVRGQRADPTVPRADPAAPRAAPAARDPAARQQRQRDPGSAGEPSILDSGGRWGTAAQQQP